MMSARDNHATFSALGDFLAYRIIDGRDNAIFTILASNFFSIWETSLQAIIHPTKEFDADLSCRLI